MISSKVVLEVVQVGESCVLRLEGIRLLDLAASHCGIKAISLWDGKWDGRDELDYGWERTKRFMDACI